LLIYNLRHVQSLNQITATEYAQKCRPEGKPLTLIGANFDSDQRKVSK
jgi:hypothetical protein